jgi:NDP-sugar pyrophosphorylase family protein
MKAGIIAAGEGSRFRAAGLETPKPLISIGGTTLLERTLRLLVDSGISEIAIIFNEQMRSLKDYIGRLNLGVNISAVIKTTESSMHSLYHLRQHLEAERFILCTVDSIMRPSEFSGFVQHFNSRPDIEILLAYTDFVDDEKPLRIGIGPDERVLSLGETAGGSPYVTSGLYGMGPNIFSVLDKALQKNLQKLRNALGLALAEGLACHGYRVSKSVDVDRPSDIAVAEELLFTSGIGTPCR